MNFFWLQGWFFLCFKDERMGLGTKGYTLADIRSILSIPSAPTSPTYQIHYLFLARSLTTTTQLVSGNQIKYMPNWYVDAEIQCWRADLTILTTHSPASLMVCDPRQHFLAYIHTSVRQPSWLSSHDHDDETKNPTGNRRNPDLSCPDPEWRWSAADEDVTARSKVGTGSGFTHEIAAHHWLMRSCQSTCTMDMSKPPKIHGACKHCPSFANWENGDCFWATCLCNHTVPVQPLLEECDTKKGTSKEGRGHGWNGLVGGSLRGDKTNRYAPLRLPCSELNNAPVWDTDLPLRWLFILMRLAVIGGWGVVKNTPIHRSSLSSWRVTTV